jgi:hypothetical protein
MQLRITFLKQEGYTEAENYLYDNEAYSIVGKKIFLFS